MTGVGVAGIEAADLERRLAGLAGVGDLGDGGVTRLSWTAEADACRVWFEQQADEIGFRCERDPAGNLWAHPNGEPPWWGVGSHLDSVRRGGHLDGPLGVAAGFEIARRSERPVAVISFAEEEGARFNTPTFGSKAITGRLDVAAVLDRVDSDGISLRDAMRRAGMDASRLGATTRWLDRLSGFLELHIDQSMAVARAGTRAATVERLATRMRLEVELRGAADHAGTTPRNERRDALAAAARVMLTAEEVGSDVSSFVVTTTRVTVEPNAFSTVPSHVMLWIDGRGKAAADVERWNERLVAWAAEHAAHSQVEIDVRVASHSPGATFDPQVRSRLRSAAERLGETGSEIVCFAGHDAGILAGRIPAGMVLVRNRSGISHAPEESVDLADAAFGATMLLHALENLP